MASEVTNLCSGKTIPGAIKSQVFQRIVKLAKQAVNNVVGVLNMFEVRNCFRVSEKTCFTSVRYADCFAGKKLVKVSSNSARFR